VMKEKQSNVAPHLQHTTVEPQCSVKGRGQLANNHATYRIGKFPDLWGKGEGVGWAGGGGARAHHAKYRTGRSPDLWLS